MFVKVIDPMFPGQAEGQASLTRAAIFLPLSNPVLLIRDICYFGTQWLHDPGHAVHERDLTPAQGSCYPGILSVYVPWVFMILKSVVFSSTFLISYAGGQFHIQAIYNFTPVSKGKIVRLVKLKIVSAQTTE